MSYLYYPLTKLPSEYRFSFFQQYEYVMGNTIQFGFRRDDNYLLCNVDVYFSHMITNSITYKSISVVDDIIYLYCHQDDLQSITSNIHLNFCITYKENYKNLRKTFNNPEITEKHLRKLYRNDRIKRIKNNL